MDRNKSVELIKNRYSCRSYTEMPLSGRDRVELSQYMSQKIIGPKGGSARFILFAAEKSDSDELKGLGTYGFIRNPAAFIAGIVNERDMDLEDFGYSMERIILQATGMGLGTCWLGGSFSKSSFSRKAGISDGEMIPAVVSVGNIADKKTVTDRIIRLTAGSDKRKKRDELFFDSGNKSLEIDYNSGYGQALEMVRIAPSASNKQPWRIVKEEGGNVFHFFLERTPGYNSKWKRVVSADLQRIDMGIAMCHFECVAIDSRLRGVWRDNNPSGIKIPDSWEYSITWGGEEI